MSRDLVTDIIKVFLTVATTFGFFGCLWMLMERPAPEGNREVLLVMTGALGAAWGNNIIGWAFGSSASSSRKDDTISALSKT